VIPAVRLLYDYAWFVGLIVSAAVYVVTVQRADATAENAEMNAEGS